MAKLWQKDYDVNKETEKFTVGNDYVLDKALLPYDIYGSMAHAAMLKKIGILTANEFAGLKKELTHILKNTSFEIAPSDEDVHTAIENELTRKLSALGKKIHTARSRNDQVLLDTRLYTKDNLLEIKQSVLELANALLEVAEKNKAIPFPGYTHTQKAMPSSVGLWAGAFAESLMDDVLQVNAAYRLNDQSPLGSAAGYGVSLPIDRQYVADLLGFAKVQNNVLYVQNSRGKIELAVLSALNQIALTLNKLATDLIWFSTPEFGYFEMPKEFCTGSSIMPQKKNPDVLELVRARSAMMEGYLVQLNNIIKNHISGYHRDFQLTKEPLLNGIETSKSTVKIMTLVMKGLKINKENCIKACTPELFATDKALELVRKGMPFRDAYKEVGLNLDKLKNEDPVKNILSKKHIGATGNLGLEKIKKQLRDEFKQLKKEQQHFHHKIKTLIS